MSGLITNYMAIGLASARPVSPTITSGAAAFYFATDTLVLSTWSGAAWVNLASGTAALLNADTDGTLAANSDLNVATQKATKTYVDAKVAGLSWKQAVRAATTVNGTLASAYANGSTIDGVTLATGDRILVKNQTAGSENGIYIVAASGAPSRATDADSSAELVNASVYISEGTTFADTQWTCTTNAPITVGSTSLAFAQLTSGGGALLAVNSLSDVASIVASADNLFTKGTNIASASTTNLATATGNFVDVTGTTTITGLGTAAAGVERTVRFTGILTLTYNATSLILPTAANITTAAGDVARFRSLGSGNWVCVAYQRASGQALASSGGGGTTVAFVGQPLFRGNNGTVVGANFFSGRALLMPSTGSITAIAVFCTAAQATAKLLPGVYTSDSSGNIATLLGTGPQVTGVTFGLNIIPLTTPVAVTAGDLVYVGCQLTVINTAFASMASNIDTVAFSSASALPSTAGAGTYGTNGGGSFFAKMV